MTNVMKKISALLLSLALVMTMMSLMALEANAGNPTAFGVSVNGVAVGSVTRERLETGEDVDTYVYPFPSGQGKNWTYALAKGAPYANIVKESLGISSLDAISGAIIGWNNEEGQEQGKGNGNLPVDMLENGTTVFKLVDENGDDITGAFNGATPTDAKAVAIEGADSTVPIISAISNTGYSTYTAALDAKENFEPDDNKARPFVGGDLRDESQNYLKKNGKVDATALNFLGKYAISVGNSGYSMNVKLAAPEAVDMAFDGPAADAKDLALGYDLPEEILSKLIAGATWRSADETVAKVEDGKVVPVGVGSTTITATFPTATTGVEGTINVTVKKSIKDAKVVLSATSFTYNGKVRKPTIKTIGGETLKSGTDYTAKWSNTSSKKVGSYTITITGKGKYFGVTKATYKIVKAANPLKIKALTGTVKYSKVKKKAQTLKVGKVIKVTKKGQGKLTYTKSSGNKKITINKTNGKVTVKKGLKKGTYKVKVKVKAAGNANYKAITRTVTFKVKVK